MIISIRALAFATFAAFCAACSPDDVGAGGKSGGYNLEIRATPGEQIYLVTAPNGHIVGGRAEKGRSDFMDESAVRAAIAQARVEQAAAADPAPTTTTTDNPNHVS